MRIYTATSWRNETAVKRFAEMFRQWGHEVYCFAELGDGQHIFMWPDAVTPDDDGITCLDTDDSRRAFMVDKKHLDWAECCVLILPCGRDAHLEAGILVLGHAALQREIGIIRGSTKRILQKYEM